MILLILLTFMAACHKKPYYSNPITVVLNTAASLQGTPYRYGGRNPRGFDCSGFAWYCYDRAGIVIPATTKQQRKAGKKIARSLKFSKLKPGDLLFFKMKKIFGHPNHVGIYAGHKRMYHASSSRGVVLENLNNRFWKKHFSYARRIVK
ncbi:MAG: C40 family peptidase [Acidobacteria bacterium]|nr:C40 family peptidase [Acidobacteriota bacterium]